LSSNNFCAISQIPFDVVVKLNSKTECSCTIYYLYRIVRRLDAPNGIKEWLSFTPECYRNLILDKTNPKRLESLESECKFNELVQNCRAKNSIQDEDIDDTKLECQTSSPNIISNQNELKNVI
jgi:tRNA uridine 5-carbamoylmethylation protein Kti12